ncbi:hypothetical protein BLOT_011146 [Blomia tropicalis]|nr:hypothetical protein BLOT_011146 [Blomia tropicalis]
MDSDRQVSDIQDIDGSNVDEQNLCVLISNLRKKEKRDLEEFSESLKKVRNDEKGCHTTKKTSDFVEEFNKFQYSKKLELDNFAQNLAKYRSGSSSTTKSMQPIEHDLQQPAPLEHEQQQPVPFVDEEILDEDEMQLMCIDEDNEDDENDEVSIIDIDTRIYSDNLSNRPISTQERNILILLHQAHFNLANSETMKMVKLFNNLCQTTSSQGPMFETTSWDTLIKKVPFSFIPTIWKYFYSRCGQLIGPVNDISSNVITCENNHEGCSINPKKESKDSNSYFCYVSLKDWLQHQIPLLYSSLRIKRRNLTKYYHDLASSSRYSELVSESNETITLTLTWDGVLYCERTRGSMWPLVAYINELPFQQRINNPMLCALHCGQTKPSSDLMFKPIIDELVTYEKTPLSILINEEEKLFFVKILLVIADAPARSVILNCNQFNAKLGCHCCYVEGKRNTKFNSTVFLPTKKTGSTLNFDDNLRDNVSWREMANSNDTSKGVKGQCQLMRLSYVDMSIICPPEVMHSQFLGTTKSLIERWLGKDVLNKQWYKNLSNEEKMEFKILNISMEGMLTLDQRLSSTKFPHRVHKSMPKFVNETSLKSLDYELILFFGWVCFDGLINEDRFKNFKRFSLIISSLSSRHVSKVSTIRQIKNEIGRFYFEFDQIYRNEEFMFKMNLHFITHLPDMVVNYGPLPIQSAYFTDNTHGVFGKRVKSGTNIAQQKILKCLNSNSIYLIVNEFLNCKKCAMEDSNLEFQHIYTYSKISNTSKIINLSESDCKYFINY